MTSIEKLKSDLNPAIAAMEDADKMTVVLTGFIGGEAGPVVRLYPALDTNYYMELPNDAIIDAEADTKGEPGKVRIVVSASLEASFVHRTNENLRDLTDRPQRVESPFGACVRRCSGNFETRAFNILRNSRLSEEEIRSLLAAAFQTLEWCLKDCALKHDLRQLFRIKTIASEIAKSVLPEGFIPGL